MLYYIIGCDNMEKIEHARKFCEEVRKLALEYHVPFFVVTDGASATNNNGCEAVRHARNAQIEWEKEHGFDPYEDWGKMSYQLEESTEEDIETLKRHKFASVFSYAKDLTNEEKEKIENYVNEEIPKQIGKSQMIKKGNETIGSLFVRPYEDGVLLDEIYLEEEWRDKGIGTKLIKQVISENQIVYLFVYQENEKAISLYKRLDFKVIEETKERFLMKYE